MRSRILTVCGLLCSTIISGPAIAEIDEAVTKQLQAMQAQIQQLQEQNRIQQEKAQNQIQQLQAQLIEVKNKASAPSIVSNTIPANHEVDKIASLSPSSGQPAAVASSTGGWQNKNIKLTMGGYVEATGIMRSRTESNDITTNWLGIPFPYLPANHLSEFRGTARQSRLTLLAQGAADPDTAIAAFFEGDFLGAANTASSTQSNAYNPRVRQAYATIDMNDVGFHVLGGQAWSFITPERRGLLGRQENIPIIIDSGSDVVGFNWTRNTQVRLVKDFDNKQVWAGISLESPQTIVNNSGVGTPSGNPVTGLSGTGTFSTNTYSLDVAPDVIAKVAFDPGYGHYEVYGVGRFFRVRTNKQNHIIEGGGVGLATLLPIIKNKLEFNINGLVGRGIGRYGNSQLPDVTVKPDGTLATVGEVEVMAGLTGHPTTAWDIYMYAGVEQSQKTSFGTAFGYGNPNYHNDGCNTEGAAASLCIANTRRLSELTGGTWWKFYQGSYGMMETGLQHSYTRRDTFAGIGGAPNVDENVTMLSFRYYPF